MENKENLENQVNIETNNTKNELSSIINEENKNVRKPTHKINSHILNRWSPRSFTGDKLTHEELMSLFEAARWAPSSYNHQPWRFIYAKKDSNDWSRMFNLIDEFNQVWAKNADVLVLIISLKNFEYNGKLSRTYHFDTGAAWAYLALEATIKGLSTHAMEGFDYNKARTDLDIPADYDIFAINAIGKQGPRESLPSDLRDEEFPSGRKPLHEIVMEGTFRYK